MSAQHPFAVVLLSASFHAAAVVAAPVPGPAGLPNALGPIGEYQAVIIFCSMELLLIPP